jgi:hypothetical protein
MAPKMSARGLESREEAAPVLWGGPPAVLVPVGLIVAEAEEERESVAETMVLLVPAEGLMEAEAAALETRGLRLERTEEAEAAALEAAEAADDTADEAEATADDKEPDPPDRGNWPE